jgi:hypothetical protein
MKVKAIKATISFVLVILIFLMTQDYYISAQKNTSTEKLTISTATLKISSPSSTIINEEVKVLKDKIATKVAELQKQNKRVITGLIIKKYNNFIELKSESQTYKVTIDDILTKIYSVIDNTQKEIKFENLTNGDFVIVSGPLIENSINANYICKDQQYITASGKITEINKNDYSFKIINPEKDEFTLDIESYTKQQIMDIKTLKITPAGFSKIKEGDTIHFVAKKPSVEKFSRLSGIRTLIIPQEYFIVK